MARDARRKRERETYTITFTHDQAVALGLVTCKCGHPCNNHFDWELSPCAHCDCKRYNPRVRDIKKLVAS